MDVDWIYICMDPFISAIKFTFVTSENKFLTLEAWWPLFWCLHVAGTLVWKVPKYHQGMIFKFERIRVSERSILACLSSGIWISLCLIAKCRRAIQKICC